METTTTDPILMLRHEIVLPTGRYHTKMRMPLSRWKEELPFLDFGNEDVMYAFQEVPPLHLERELVLKVCNQVLDGMEAPFAQIIEVMVRREEESTDATTKYAYRLAADALRKELQKWEALPAARRNLEERVKNLVADEIAALQP